MEKLSDIQTKINDLKSYYGESGIIPHEFKGEQVKIAEDNNGKNKSLYASSFSC